MDIIGIRGVKEALKGKGEVLRLIVQDKTMPKLRDILDLAQERHIPIKEDPTYFGQFTRAAQGVALQVPEFRYKTLEELLSLPEEERRPLCVLDSIQDVGNLGSIIRSASVFGIKALILPKDRSAKITPAVLKTAQGGMEDVDIVQVTNLSRALRTLKDQGYWIAACHMEGEPVDHMPDGPLVFILGNEGEGIRPGVLKEADYILTIPMDPQSAVGCLNAGCAASILFYTYFQKSKTW